MPGRCCITAFSLVLAAPATRRASCLAPPGSLGRGFEGMASVAASLAQVTTAAAQEAGLAVHVICRCSDARADLEAAGCRVLPLEGRRSDLSPGSAIRES